MKICSLFSLQGKLSHQLKASHLFWPVQRCRALATLDFHIQLWPWATCYLQSCSLEICSKHLTYRLLLVIATFLATFQNYWPEIILPTFLGYAFLWQVSRRTRDFLSGVFGSVMSPYTLCISAGFSGVFVTASVITTSLEGVGCFFFFFGGAQEVPLCLAPLPPSRPTRLKSDSTIDSLARFTNVAKSVALL